MARNRVFWRTNTTSSTLYWWLAASGCADCAGCGVDVVSNSECPCVLRRIVRICRQYTEMIRSQMGCVPIERQEYAIDFDLAERHVVRRAGVPHSRSFEFDAIAGRECLRRRLWPIARYYVSGSG